MAFGVSAAYGGLAGTMLMMNRPFASDVQFGLTLAIFLVVGLVAGGAGTISGAIPGAFIYVFVPYFVSRVDPRPVGHAARAASRPPDRCSTGWRTGPGGDAISGVFFGLGLLLLVFLLPGGFIAGMRKLRARFVQVHPEPVVARRRRAGHRAADRARGGRRGS